MKIRARWILIPAILLTLLCVGAIYVLESAWVREKVRTLIVTEVEKATGGTTTLAAFDFDWRTLKVSATDFVLHGKEGRDRAPFVRARTVRVGLTIQSWLHREVRLTEAVVEKPEVHIYTSPDGTTNIPEPKTARKTSGAPLEDLFRLKIGRLEVREGVFEYDSRRVPFSVLAQGVETKLTYDRLKPRYLGTLTVASVRLPGELNPRVEAGIVLEANRVSVERLKAFIGDSVAEFTGAIEDFRNPKIDGAVHASVLLRDVKISPVRQGFTTVSGKLHYDVERGFVMDGTVQGEQVAYRSKEFKLTGGRLNSGFHLTTSALTLRELKLQTPFGDWQGDAALHDWRGLELKGEATRVDVDALQAAFLEHPYPWSGAAQGPLSFKGELTEAGLRNGFAEVALTIEPKPGQIPVSGNLNLAWTQASGRVSFGLSSLATDGARVDFHGVLGDRLEVGFHSTRIRDLEPVIAMFRREAEYTLPVHLDRGEARFNGVITGPINALDIQGHATASRVVLEGLVIDRAAADIHVTKALLEFGSLEVQTEKAVAAGSLRTTLKNWSVEWDNPFDAKLRLTQVDIKRLAQMAKSTAPVQGTINATLEAGGTFGLPHGHVELQVDGAEFGTEKFKDLKGQFTLDPSGTLSGFTELEGAKVELAGFYRHPSGNFTDGELSGTVKIAELSLQQVEAVQAARPGLAAVVSGEVKIRMELANGETRLRTLEGQLAAPAVKVGIRELGALLVSGSTTGETLKLKLRQGLAAGELEGDASIGLTGNYLVEGSVKTPRIGLGLLRDLARTTESQKADAPWPVRGFIQGQATFRFPLMDPTKATAVLTVNSLQLRPRQDQIQETQIDTSELTLRNAGPVVLEVDEKSARLKSAKFTARDTDLTLAGTYTMNSKNPWNLNVQGAVNLAVLGSYYTDLLPTGSAKIEATVRGAATDPQFSGRMSIENASFFLRDLPNGVENATGTVFFDRNRANIEKLTGQTGGGAFEITGFVGFASDEPTYRLKLTAKTVRVRYPEGVSTTLDAVLTLTGSTSRSLLAGTVTILKSGLNSGADLANAVGETGNPIPSAAAQNQFLRNLQFDVRVLTSPDAVFQSNYTQDLQTEADLRLRGSPSKPMLLGGIKANQGVVKFLGNQFTISRGEVLFYNTVSVQPQIDLDLETRLRGITVYINVNGPLSRLNFSYRSEPPLQSSEIMALITVGRTPVSTTSSLATADNIRSQNVMENSPNSLLGGAISAGLSSRAERFFGSSRIRLDPNAAGVENLPQAKLSIEQSISRDITLTVITNLGRSQQQVVRVDWDFSRQWSVVALKDENGFFAVDFLLRRRFK